jgi:hypothetical protein
MTMPGAEAHIIVRSQGGIHVMIDYFTDIALANSDDGLCLDSTFLQTKQKQNRITCQITETTITILNHNYTATKLRWQSTIDMMMKSSTEQRIFKEGDSRVYTIKSYRHVEAHREPVNHDTHRQVYQESTKILPKPPIKSVHS